VRRSYDRRTRNFWQLLCDALMPECDVLRPFHGP
jgi:hypothetical protein